MDKRDSQRYDSALLVKGFMGDHDTELTPITTYAPLKAAFNTGMGKMSTALEAQAEDITMWSAEKAVTWDTMAQSILKYSMKASVQAFTLNNFDLELSLDKPLTYFTSCDDTKALERATFQKDIIKTNILILTEVKAIDITEMETKITAFQNIRLQPKAKRQARSADGFDPVNGILNDIDIPKIRIGKIVHAYLPDLISDWDKAAKIGKTPNTHHTSIAIQYLSADTNMRLKNVKCTITNGVKTISKISGAKGWVHFYSLTGDWTITSGLATYETDVQTKVGTDNDIVVDLKIALKKKVVPDNGNPQPDPETTTGIADLYAFIKSTGAPLPDAQYVINGTNRVGTTDEDGNGYEDLLAPGTYTGTLYMDGYKDLPFSFTITAGQITTINLYMEAAV